MGYAMKHIAVNIVILLGLNTFSCRKKVFFSGQWKLAGLFTSYYFYRIFYCLLFNYARLLKLAKRNIRVVWCVITHHTILRYIIEWICIEKAWQITLSCIFFALTNYEGNLCSHASYFCNQSFLIFTKGKGA